MEYFTILNLVREPFSNSPEPDLFYQSPKHVRCLQNLELAIRLRRGLNVVLGRVGTGKTTLCRHMIGRFAGEGAGDNAIETHLLMDPSFSTPREFLTTVAAGFGMAPKAGEAAAGPGMTDWQLKEAIKDYLFKKGVEEKAIVALIIDEGQKLPEYCLEILREFLNYETNENKLLQIVIFAQPEFRQVLDRLENFADRVNLLYVLQPLNFRETRDMIRFRLTRAGEPGSVPELFTPLGLLAVYLATGGYPRKIVTLCHQAVLALIIQNRSRAGWRLVRSCAARLASAGAGTRTSRVWRWTAILAAAAAALLIFLLVRPLPIVPVGTPAAPSPEPAAQTPPAVEEARANPALPPAQPEGTDVGTQRPLPAEGAARAVPEAPREVRETADHAKPDLLGKLALREGQTMWSMLTDLYGEYNQKVIREVSRANPGIKNLNRVQAGTLIRLPALAADDSPLAGSGFRVRIAPSENLEETYALYRAHKADAPSLIFLPCWNPRQGMVFSITLRENFPDEAAARQGIGLLPAALASRAEVIAAPERDAVYYTR